MSQRKKEHRITVSLDEETRRRVEAVADEVGGSLSFIIRKAVRLYLRNRRRGG